MLSEILRILHLADRVGSRGSVAVWFLSRLKLIQYTFFSVSNPRARPYYKVVEILHRYGLFSILNKVSITTTHWYWLNGLMHYTYCRSRSTHGAYNNTIRTACAFRKHRRNRCQSVHNVGTHLSTQYLHSVSYRNSIMSIFL